MREHDLIELTDEELIEVAGGQGWSVDPMGLSAAPRSPGGAGITMDPNG